MNIGVPKELKVREYRVGMVPGGVRLLTDAGHKVLIQKDAGIGAGISNDDFRAAGATILGSAKEIWESAELIVKVKEPIAYEYEFIKEHHILYTFLHLAAESKLTEVLLKSGCSAIAYETIELNDGSLPLLKPMSEVAGRMSVQVGACCLQKHWGGKGLLLGGVPGVRRGRVCIIGGGHVGTHAAKMAIGLGARVSILDIDQNRLAYLDDIFGNQINTVYSNPSSIAEYVERSDLVIGAVLITGDKAPVLVTKEMVKKMQKGSVIVDVAIDQGGCTETIKATTHDNPVYQYEGVGHYGVTNIPGDVPMTSTYALTNVTTKYLLDVANKGFSKAVKECTALRKGINIYRGKLTNSAVARSLNTSYSEYSN
jgi:alanine dehydrogenase